MRDALHDYLPYVLHRLEAPGHTFLAMNREYKPLGVPMDTWPWVDYYDYLPQAVRFKRDPHLYKEMWTDHPNPNWLFLRDDATPVDVYFQRIKRLYFDIAYDSLSDEDVRKARNYRIRKYLRRAIAVVGLEAVNELLARLGIKSRLSNGRYLPLDSIAYFAMHQDRDKQVIKDLKHLIEGAPSILT